MKMIWAASIAFALALSACDSVGEPEPPEPVWYGQIRNSCGPTDAPVATIGIDTTAYPNCSNPFPEEYIRLDAGVSDLDSVAAGQVFKAYWMQFTEEHSEIRIIQVKIERVAAEGIQAWIRMDDSIKGGGTVLVREGRALLEKCRERPICG